MAGRIPQAFIDELIARTDIVELIGGRVQLKKAGREWKACCPFHNEKTPSFWVSPDKQFYHCFGCGAHGTALGFLMEHDKLPFPDAVEELASRLGLEVPREGGDAPRARPGEDLYELLASVTQFYRDSLRESPRAKSYLEARGVTAESGVKFAVGYAPDSWDAVLKRFGGSPGARARAAGGRPRRRAQRQGRVRLLRPLPRPHHVPDPRRARPADRFRRADPRQGRAEVPELARDRAVPQGPRAVRALRGAAGAAQGRAAAGRRGLRGRRAPRAVRHRLVGRDARHGDDARAPQPPVSRHERARVLLRRRPRRAATPPGARSRTRSSTPATGASSSSCSCPRDTTPTRWSARKAPRPSRRASPRPCRSRSSWSAQLVARTDLSSVDGRARLAELARPLLARVPPGVYHELLVERLAEAVRMPAGRLAQLLRSRAPAAKSPAGSAAARARQADRLAPRGASRS